MTINPRIVNSNLKNQQSVNIFEESLTDPPDIYYLTALSDFVNQSLTTKELFLFSGILNQLKRLGLYREEVKFLNSWCGFWWKTFESEKLREESITNLCSKLGIEEWLIRSYLRTDFFEKYEQAKNKYESRI